MATISRPSSSLERLLAMETQSGLRSVFDTERFIREIRFRTILWDNTAPSYGDKIKKNQCWEELGSMFIPGWDGMLVDEQQLLVRSLQKRWKNLRDCFKKELNATKSKSASKRKRPYIFFKHMKFLIPVTENKEGPTISINNPSPVTFQSNTEDNEDVAEETIEPSISICELPIPKRPLPPPDDPDEDDQPKNRKQKKFENQLLDILSKSVSDRQIATANQDEDRLFLLSLVNDLKKVPENRKLEVKMAMMRCIQKAQEHQSYAEDEYINSPNEAQLIEVMQENDIKEEIDVNSDDDET